MNKASETSGRMRRLPEKEHTFSIPDPSQLLKDVVSWGRENGGRWLPKAACLVMAILIISAAWNSIKEFLQEDQLTDGLKDSGALGPALLSVIQLLQVVIAVIPGDIFIIVAGKVCEFLCSLSINILSTLAASMIAFTVARYAGRKAIDRLVPAKVIDRWMAVAEKRGTVFFMISFLAPIFPADVMNFIAGLS